MAPGTPTLHLRIEVDLDEKSTTAAVPFPAIYPSPDADAAVDAARKYAPMIRPLAAVARSTPEYRSVCKIVNGKQTVYLTLYDAILVYQLGWQWIGDLRRDDGHRDFPPQYLALLCVRKEINKGRVQSKEREFVDELLEEESVAWMRQIIAVVASDGERDA